MLATECRKGDSRFLGRSLVLEGSCPVLFRDRTARRGARLVTYGWGMIPASVTVGSTTLATALWPEDGTSVVPLKLALRRAEKVEEGGLISVILEIGS